MSENYTEQTPEQRSLIGKLLRWCLENKLVVGLLVLFIVALGVMVAPFDWEIGGLDVKPVATDAIPDIGENQQIIFTEWMGRSPQDVKDQVSYPLTVALQGIKDVRTIRSYSMFGFSTIYMIFEKDMSFYDARTRILEKLNSLRHGIDYPEGTRPQLGPDSTALGQIFWYTLEGRDADGKPIGGRPITQTVEGRERFPVRVRYQRELRDRIETLGTILVPGKEGTQIPLMELADIQYVRGPQVIKSEDTFLTGYVLFDKKPGEAEVDVVERAQAYLEQKRQSGELTLPAGVIYTFAGNYENQIRSQKTLMVVLPLALFVIFLILYFQFKRVSTTLLIFSGIFVAWSGGFILLWMYGQPWFLDFSVFGVEMRELLQVHSMNLSVAVWVGFLALFGIATDNGVIQSTYLDQIFREQTPGTIDGARNATVAAAKRRIRPCLMTSATTILALIPVLTSVGRGSDVMVPMAIPSFGGMLVVLMSVFVVPVLYCWIEEIKLRPATTNAADHPAASVGI